MKSLKEKAVLAMLVTVILYGLAVALWFTRQQGEWNKARKRYATACKTYQKECRLIERRQELSDAYDAERSAMPADDGLPPDSTWVPIVVDMAKANHITVTRSGGGKPVVAGEVIEYPIEIGNWEGALEPLVKFMHELENTDKGMFDISALSFKPSSKKGYLKSSGTLTVTCAYMREK